MVESPLLPPPVAERDELLSAVGVRVAEAVVFPPLELGAPLPPVAVMVLAGSEEVTVAEASCPVHGGTGFDAFGGGVEGGVDGRR